MAVIRPFRAVRPAPEVVRLVASVPYDVLNKDEAADLAKGNPLSFLRVTRSEIECKNKVDVYSSAVYDKAKENFERLKNEAPLIQEEEPHLYVYQLIMGSQTQTGIAATFSVEDYNNDVIKKHEKTRKVKEDDRTNHIITTNAQTGAVFLTYHGTDDVNQIVEETKKNAPLYDFTSADGIRHTVWIMSKEYSAKVTSSIAKVPYLYIADGHHRAASASRAQKEKSKMNPAHTGKEEYNFFLAVLFPAEQLAILPYNRVVIDLNNITKDELFNKFQENFRIVKAESPSPAQPRTFCFYFENEWYEITPNENVKPGETLGDNLDVSILQNYLLHPMLGIGDPRTDNNIDFIGGIRGTAELEKLVNEGKAQIAFSLYPVSIEDLIKISDAGEIMPPKSTWFEPKLRDGLLIHTI